jgi:hypothetical protein
VSNKLPFLEQELHTLPSAGKQEIPLPLVEPACASSPDAGERFSIPSFLPQIKA